MTFTEMPLPSAPMEEMISQSLTHSMILQPGQQLVEGGRLRFLDVRILVFAHDREAYGVLERMTGVRGMRCGSKGSVDLEEGDMRAGRS